ncbi:MAG: hypothetical protein J6Q92_01885 [Oscillospiraceae bacterium]|nr:hypothetical protein [Oscillospiraceae bacterium]
MFIPRCFFFFFEQFGKYRDKSFKNGRNKEKTKGIDGEKVAFGTANGRWLP